MNGTNDIRTGLQRKRLVRAYLIVAALVAAVPASAAVADAVSGEAAGVSGGVSISALFADDPYRALEELEQVVAESCEPSREFAAEIGIPGRAREVRADADGSVVGYLVDGSAADALEEVRGRMAQRGWEEVPLGDVAGATFVKDSGEIRWTLVTATGVGTSASVVFRCVVR